MGNKKKKSNQASSGSSLDKGLVAVNSTEANLDDVSDIKYLADESNAIAKATAVVAEANQAGLSVPDATAAWCKNLDISVAISDALNSAGADAPAPAAAAVLACRPICGFVSHAEWAPAVPFVSHDLPTMALLSARPPQGFVSHAEWAPAVPFVSHDLPTMTLLSARPPQGFVSHAEWAPAVPFVSHDLPTIAALLPRPPQGFVSHAEWAPSVPFVSHAVEEQADEAPIATSLALRAVQAALTSAVTSAADKLAPSSPPGPTSPPADFVPVSAAKLRRLSAPTGKGTPGIMLRERTRSRLGSSPTQSPTKGHDEVLTLSDRLVEVPQGYVLVSTDVLEQYIVQSHPDEESARIAASAYWCCWILFAEERGVMRELKRGGVGWSFNAIREHVAKSSKVLPLAA